MKFRIARHTNNLKQLTDFYVKIVGLDILGEFKNHSGYDGIFLGKNNFDWHLEFTQSTDKVEREFDIDNILVFYPETQAQYDNFINKLTEYKIELQVAKNPYWRENGITIKDPDGHCVVFSNQKIKTI